MRSKVQKNRIYPPKIRNTLFEVFRIFLIAEKKGFSPFAPPHAQRGAAQIIKRNEAASSLVSE